MSPIIKSKLIPIIARDVFLGIALGAAAAWAPMFFSYALSGFERSPGMFFARYSAVVLLLAGALILAYLSGKQASFLRGARAVLISCGGLALLTFAVAFFVLPQWLGIIASLTASALFAVLACNIIGWEINFRQLVSTSTICVIFALLMTVASGLMHSALTSNTVLALTMLSLLLIAAAGWLFASKLPETEPHSINNLRVRSGPMTVALCLLSAVAALASCIMLSSMMRPELTRSGAVLAVLFFGAIAMFAIFALTERDMIWHISYAIIASFGVGALLAQVGLADGALAFVPVMCVSVASGGITLLFLTFIYNLASGPMRVISSALGILIVLSVYGLLLAPYRFSDLLGALTENNAVLVSIFVLLIVPLLMRPFSHTPKGHKPPPETRHVPAPGHTAAPVHDIPAAAAETTAAIAPALQPAESPAGAVTQVSATSPAAEASPHSPAAPAAPPSAPASPETAVTAARIQPETQAELHPAGTSGPPPAQEASARVMDTQAAQTAAAPVRTSPVSTLDSAPAVPPEFDSVQAAIGVIDGFDPSDGDSADGEAKTLEQMLLDQLTNAERKVFELVVQGYANKEIGAKLYISVNTVKFHVKNILAKAGVNSKYRLVNFLSAPAGTRPDDRFDDGAEAEDF